MKESPLKYIDEATPACFSSTNSFIITNMLVNKRRDRNPAKRHANSITAKESVETSRYHTGKVSTPKILIEFYRPRRSPVKGIAILEKTNPTNISEARLPI